MQILSVFDRDTVRRMGRQHRHPRAPALPSQNTAEPSVLCRAANPSIVHPPPLQKPSTRTVSVLTKSHAPPPHVGCVQSTNLHPPPSHVGAVQPTNRQPPPRQRVSVEHAWKPHRPALHSAGGAPSSAHGVGTMSVQRRDEAAREGQRSRAAASSVAVTLRRMALGKGGVRSACVSAGPSASANVAGESA